MRAAKSSKSRQSPASTSVSAAPNPTPDRKYIGKVDKEPYETITGPMPDWQTRAICHVDIWHSECRMFLRTTAGDFYAPPFDSQEGEYGLNDYRIFQTKVLREVFTTFEVREALLVDFQHGQIITPINGKYGTVHQNEAIAFAIEVRAPIVDLDTVKEQRAKRRFDKLKERLNRGGKKLRSKRKKLRSKRKKRNGRV